MRPGVLFFLAVSIGSVGHVQAQTSPANERRTVDRSRRLREAGRLEEARTQLTDLLARNPASIDALTLLHELSEEDGAYGAFLPYAEAAARAPGGETARIRQLWVEGLIGAELADSALHVAFRWVAEEPSGELAALGLAAANVARGDRDKGATVLGDAVARGIGSIRIEAARADLLVALDRVGDAVHVWASLLAFGDPAIAEVAQDLRGLGDVATGLDPLLNEIDGGGAAAAGAVVALRLDDPVGSRRLATGVQVEDRSAFLRTYVREAGLADLPGEVAWAAQQLVFLSPRAADKLRWRLLAADRSLAAGDTASALGEFETLTSETRTGGGPHEAATQRLFELLTADPSRLDEAEALLRRYAAESPDSARVRAVMVGQLAVGYARAGDLRRGEEVLRDARSVLAPEALGPVNAAGGSLSFWTGSRDSTLARTGRSLAEPGLPPEAQTARLRLLTLAQAADSSEIGIAGPAAYGLLQDPRGYDPGPALRALAGTPDSRGRSAVLAYLGELAEAAGRPTVADGLRRRVLDRFPTSAEAPGVLLALARSAESGEARRRLEQLIVGYPESALAPIARRLLTELGGGGARE